MISSNRTLKMTIAALIIMYMFAMFFPFLWIFITSFKTSGEIFGTGAFRVIPENPTFQNFIKVVTEKGILDAIKTSLIVATSTTVYIVLVATFAAYAISRFEFKGKNILLGLILAVSMFPQMIIIGPVYNLFLELGLTNSYAIILPYSTITLPMAVWILVTHFNQIPLALEESAKIDGATPLQTLFKIVFPLAAPGVFTTAIIVFIAAWNEFLLTITINSNKEYHTVPVAISFLRTQFEILWGEVAAATTIVTIPTLILVLFFQKQIVSGLTSGGVKE
ncbi:carbohydrate ABC transporter membrane protein 2, CUT1 family [Schinkia azotoformans MEV2011]|uniref:Carbohydrate ABC transporter membrane protein 2, CUT1 family n=1 Tax=Schinkia azotoformans MEV2011 TaxID=1348973 RepID=A0A072NSE2_SCHAZ|nr:carbohydrate ABC transporter permease [Schinkia azotoformans]KEF36115.1 carbohydrate ABC transporter membrane protein 2, CUT1 family [Schinkia azotoformans MEV2011]MEC1695523.1 carbohydrate ABC transporter permease [Schinkia azotoformans]MEC1718609.1 carbohydrate ABC transporter permease [Schinkia azotoformans]MEC1727172.1 carbohydrate ABC transporter permease [Schinkia azotoformans]MEC1743591.1 carbohydrate ABC transporter permease [Schinkia azotoformans]